MRRPAHAGLRGNAYIDSSRQSTEQAERRGFAFFLVLLSLLVEFGRPQDVVPGLRAVPFPSIIDTLIALTVIVSGKFTLANRQTKLWLGLIALMVIHVPFATNNFWAAMVLKDMLMLFAFYLGVITYINRIDKLRTLAAVWLGVHLVLAVFGTLNGGTGVGGWLGDENDFCMELNVAISFAYFGLFWSSSQFKKPVYLTILCILVLATLMTLSRGGFIGLVSMGTYCWLRSSKKVAAVLLAGLLAIFVLLAAPESYWEEMQSITSDQTMETGTGGERLYSWGLGWEMFLGNPVIGVGQGNYPWTLGDYEAGRRFNQRSLAGRQAHSAYFTLLPELGLVGLCLFLAFVFSSFKDTQLIQRIATRTASQKNTEQVGQDLVFIMNFARAIEGGFIAYLVSSVFISTLYYPSFWVLTAFTVALRNVAMKQVKADDLELSPLFNRPGMPRVVQPVGFRRWS